LVQHDEVDIVKVELVLEVIVRVHVDYIGFPLSITLRNGHVVILTLSRMSWRRWMREERELDYMEVVDVLS
jgi:phage host-nuclease inhibitor protein Gam